MSLPDDFEVRVGDALEELKKLPGGCVQTCVTSPPYWGLRDYGVDGQLGLEPTPDAYVEKLVSVFGEVRRVLREDGTLWLNLGDSYAGNRSYQVPDNKHTDVGNSRGMTTSRRRDREEVPRADLEVQGLKPKDMVGIPWRVAFALQQDGWWLRSDIVWHKTNPMPESVTDRPTSSHEHVFLLAKSRRYHYDHEAIKEQFADDRMGNPGGGDWKYADGEARGREDAGIKDLTWNEDGHATGRNKRDVWTVTTRPFPDAHFAVYPPELILPCIKAGTSQRGQCVECGAPWEREIEGVAPDGRRVKRVGRTFVDEDGNPAVGDNMLDPGERGSFTAKAGENGRKAIKRETVGWAPTCDCDADTAPQLVLDPFCGAGTTGVVCTELGRRFLGIELNPEYASMARERIMGTNPTLFRDAG